MKFLLALLLMGLPALIALAGGNIPFGFVPMAATDIPFTWTGLGGDANWNTTANWSTNVVPGASDTAHFTGPACASNCSPTINLNISVAGMDIQSSYAGTITQSSTRTITVGAAGWTQAGGTFVGTDAAITMNGPWTFSAGAFTSTSATLSLTSDLVVSGSPTFTHNSGTFSVASTISLTPGSLAFNNVSFGGNARTYTLTGTLTVDGTLSLADTSSGSLKVINGGTILAKGDVTATNYGYGGTAVLQIGGSGNQTISGTINAQLPALEIASTGGTVTFSGYIFVTGPSYTVTSGTVDTTGSTLTLSGGNKAITPGTVGYNHVTLYSNTATYTLTGTMTVNGTFTFGCTTSGVTKYLNGGTVVAKGDVTITDNGIKGTTLIQAAGSGNQTLTGSATGNMPPLEIASTGGTVTLVSTLIILGDYTYTSGTVDASASTLYFNGSYSSPTITSGTVAYNNITFAGGTTAHTLVGTMTVNGTLTIADGSSSGTRTLDGGSLVANGDVVFADYGKSGTTPITFGGTASTTLTVGASALRMSGTITVAKTGAGIVTMASNAAFGNTGQNVTVSTGTLSLGGFALTVTDTLTVAVGGKLLCAGGTATAATYVFNGEISCGATHGVTWTGLAGDNTWATPGNWTGSTVPGASDVALFSSFCTGANCNATMTNALSIKGLTMRSDYTGTITQGTTVTIGTSGWTQAAGTFTGSVSNIAMNGPFALSGGTYTASSGTTTFTGSLDYTLSGAPTFNHNSGTLVFTSSSTATLGFTPGSAPYNNVTFGGNRLATNLTGTLTINGTLTLSEVYVTAGIGFTGGTIEAKGNIVTTNYGKRGSGTVLKISGTGNQSITGSATGYLPDLEIASTGGTVTLVGTIPFFANSFTYTGGVLDAGTSTILFTSNSTTTNSFTPGAVAYNNVNFSGYNLTTVLTGTLTVNGTLTLSETYNPAGIGISGGTIEAKGDVVTTGYGKRGGSGALLKISGSGNQTFTGASTGNLPDVEIISTGGTVTLTGTLKMYYTSFTYTSGTVAAGTSAMFFSSNGGATNSFTPGTVAYNDVNFSGYSLTTTLSGTLTVNGTLSFTDIYPSPIGNVNSGTIEAYGNIVATSYGKLGSTVLNINGTSSTTISSASTSKLLSTSPVINKTGGSTVTMLSNVALSVASQDLTITSGTLDLGGYDLTVNDVLTIASGTTLRCSGGTYGAPTVSNSGTLNCPGQAAYEFNWIGTAADSNWNTAANWQGGVVPSATTGYAYFDNTYCGANCNVTMNAAVNVKGVELTSGYSGTITQGAGIGVTLGSRGWTQAAGTFTGSDTDINLGGIFSLTGGTFTSTSGTLAMATGTNSWTVAAPGTFTHNSGTVTFYGTNASTLTITPGIGVYNNASIIGFANTNEISGTLTVNGNFIFGNASGTGGTINTGTINVTGNITRINNGFGGTALLRAVASTNQAISGAGTGSFPHLVIASTGGTVTLSGTMSMSNFTHTSGTVDASTSSITFGGSGATGITPGSVGFNDVTIIGSTSSSSFTLNSGTLNVLGNLTLTHNTASGGSINSGTINAAGNVSVTGSGNFTGSATLVLNGTSNTTLSSTGALKMPGATVTIAKTGGAKVTMANAMLLTNTNQDLSISAGATLDMAGYALTVARNITNAGTLRRGTNPTCGAVSQGGTYSGIAAVCP